VMLAEELKPKIDALAEDVIKVLKNGNSEG